MKNLISKEGKDRIDLICNQYGIGNYTINPDGSIDVDGDVNLMRKNLSILPLKFNKVTGDFNCAENNLTSTYGFPKTLGASLSCRDNMLTSMKGIPEVILENCDFFNNQLTSLEFSPLRVNGFFSCVKNNIRSLEGAPEYIGTYFLISHNPNMTSTYSGDVDIEVGNKIYINDTNLPKSLIQYTDKYEMLLILKYQRHFEIWNNDLTLNEENYQILLNEIKDGLK